MDLIGSVEISITTWTEEADEATNLKYSSSDMEKCTVEKNAIVSIGEAAEHFKIGTNTEMKKYLRCDKCGKYLSLIPTLLNQFTGATKANCGWGGRGYMQGKKILNAQNTEKPVSAIIAAEIFISTSSEESAEANKLPKPPIIPLVKKKFKCD